MANRGPVLPPQYQRPTPLSEERITALVNWIPTLEDPYLLAYCLHWALGASPQLIQKYTGYGYVKRKIEAFPNKCRKHLRMGAATVIGFDDLHTVFSRVLQRDLEILLVGPTGAFSIHQSNHMAYLDFINLLFEQRRMREIIDLNRRPFRKTFFVGLETDTALPLEALGELILDLPEIYERVLWMYFVGGKSFSDIHRESETHYVQGIVEYGRRLFSRRLGYADPLDDASMAAVLGAL